MDKKEIIIGIIGIVIVVGIFIASSFMNNEKETELLSGKHYIEIDVKDYGKMVLELDADKAPITVTNFINLVKDKFYDGLTFHRIMEGFMIQGGGYDESGSRKPADTIKGEFSSNGVKNDIKHERGVISMARTSVKDSASSEFFIMHEDNSTLDGNYAAFGHVVSGIEVVDEIATKAKPTDDNGSIKLEERPVITSIRVIQKVNTFEE